MKNKKIQICDTFVYPGEVANLALPLPNQYTCAPLFMPLKIMHGKKAGPCLLIFSVLTGKEINGLEITNRVNNLVDVDNIAGTVITVPVVNILGLTQYPIQLQVDYDLSNCFPGNENGSYGERIAHIFTNEILKKADYCIELQTGDINHNILPQVYCDLESPDLKKLSKQFKTPVVANFDIEGNRLRKTAKDLDIPLLVYQAGEAARFDENSIVLGVDGIMNVMSAIGILPEKPDEKIATSFSKKQEWIASPAAGILHFKVGLGQVIDEGELIGNITDPFGTNVVIPIFSPVKGIIVGINSSPLIHEGLTIFKIAYFIDYDKAEDRIEKWDKSQPDSYIT